MKLPVPPPPIDDLLANIQASRLADVLRVSRQDGTREYRHWNEIRYRSPPGDLTLEQWWLGLKIPRLSGARPLPLTDASGRVFTFNTPDILLAMAHRIDRDASGQIEMSEQVANPEMRDRYIVSSIIEEAITSSQLEGAATTRTVAADMLRSGREPSTVDERMIANNYQAMQFVQEKRNEPLTPTTVLELHRIVTENTLAYPEDAGRMQSPRDQRVHVWDNTTGISLHTPPPAGELPARLEKLCAFANDTLEVEGFIHPLLRAIILHFWLAYDHPFADGNGRTARALFYWSMLSQGYWLTEFLSISRQLKKAPAQYARAFLHTETDDNDLTYFLIHQLTTIVRVIEDLKDYLRRKMREVRQVENRLQHANALNHRQSALLAHAMRHPNAVYTIASHRRSHNVVYATARSDLLDLVQMGLLAKSRAGRRHVFKAPNDLATRLEGKPD